MEIAIVGSGNLAFHLARVLCQIGATPSLLVRNLQKGEEMKADVGQSSISVRTDYDHTNNPYDLVLIAVTEMAIEKVLDTYRFAKKTALVHLSGAVSSEVFTRAGIDNFGVFYPLQTFTKNRPVTFRGIPILIEGNNDSTLRALTSLGEKVGGKVHCVSSDDRLKVHLAAVIAGNFSNNLYAIAEDLLKGSGLALQELIPLIQETLDKANTIGPATAQTGPARRKERVILEKHLNLLADHPDLAQLYQLHSSLIQKRDD